jgi:hypothetical protein
MARALLGLYHARIAARVPISRPLLEEPLVSSMRLHGHQSPRWHLRSIANPLFGGYLRLGETHKFACTDIVRALDYW